MAYVTAEPDDSRSIGHARIVIDGLAQAPTDAGFRIIREGYPTPNLGRRGWQVGEERLKPIAVSSEGGKVVLIVGPAVTMHLQVEPYLFAVPEAGIEAALFWPDTIDVFDGEVPEETVVPPDEPPPPPVAKAPPQAPPPVPPSALTSGPDPEATRITPPPPPPPPPPAKPEPQGGSKLPLILGGVLVLLLLVGGGGTWWVMNQPQPAPAPAPTPTPAPTPVPAPTPPPPAAPVWPDGTDSLSPGDVVSRAPNPAGIHAVAVRRQAEGKHDDALVLFEEAAERGHAPSMTAVARMYDPNGFVPGRPFRNPDARAAAKYYRDAIRAGDTAAETPRAALKTTLEGLAAQGNGLAESYLREFWP